MFRTKKLKAQLDEVRAELYDIQRQLEKERQLNRDLIANVSHEIRTPIAAIMAISENLVTGISKWRPAIGQQIFEYSGKMADLVTFLLDLSKIDSGTVSLQLEPVMIGDFLEECIDPLEMQEANKNLQFVINVVPEDLEWTIDKKRFSQSIVNLISNAIRFSPPNGIVHLEAYLELDELIINILDQGPGISEADSEKIFERFRSGALSNDIGTSKATGGTGIGLSIARWAVGLHGGKLEAITSSSKTSGAMFQIRLPKLNSKT